MYKLILALFSIAMFPFALFSLACFSPLQCRVNGYCDASPCTSRFERRFNACCILDLFAARPTKPPPPPRSLPPVAGHKSPAPSADRQLGEAPIASGDSSASDSYEPVNFSAPECDRHGSPETARLTSMQYCGSETESEIYPAIQFGDDVSRSYYRCRRVMTGW